MRIALIFTLVFIPIQIFSQDSKITVELNKNIEFLGYIIEQGDPAGNDKNHPISKIINKYPENKTNETLFKLFNLASTVDYSTLVHLMYFLPELPLTNNYRVSEEFASYLGFESHDERLRLDEIVLELNNFYKESHFENIWKNLKPYGKTLKSFLEESKPRAEAFNYLEEFYQYRYKHYSIQPILTLWPVGFGIRDLDHNKAVFIMGPLNSNYDFNDKQAFINLTLHEFGHSFVNHILLKNKKELNKTESLFKPIKDTMTRQGYSDWETCMTEHFVRAGEVIIRELMGDKNQSEALLKDYIENRNFIYLEFIIDKLKFYRLDKTYSYEDSVVVTLNSLVNARKK